MATLREYFVKDGSKDLTLKKDWPISGTDGMTVTARLHLDFIANAKYVSFYIPDIPDMICPEALVLNHANDVAKWPETDGLGVTMGFGGEHHDGRELVFTGQVYLYTERPTDDQCKERLITESAGVGHRLTFRSVQYVADRNKYERPLAFISHDRRDKADIAQPLAIELNKRMCPVWYDEYTLKVGDNLRESIERGLRECKKCILVVTPNFLSNEGWTKAEFEAVFTREIIEKQGVMLPIWNDVSAKDVFDYSPNLANKLAVQWSLGVEEVARKLLHAINASG